MHFEHRDTGTLVDGKSCLNVLTKYGRTKWCEFLHSQKVGASARVRGWQSIYLANGVMRFGDSTEKCELPFPVCKTKMYHQKCTRLSSRPPHVVE